MSSTLTGHERIDRRSLAMHEAIVEKLRLHPELLAIARENLDRWYETARASRPYFDQWRQILDGPFEDLLAAIVDEGERMTALRQSSPFAGILTPQERWGIYARFERSTAPASE